MMSDRTLLAATLFCAVAAAPASAQIIATSLPRDVPAGQQARTWRLHGMGGYANWQVTDEEFGTAGVDGFIFAGDLAFRPHSGRLDFGAGGWVNQVSNGGGTISSLYANAFYSHVGVQAGLLFGGGSTDPIVLVVGRTGGEHRATASAGVGLVRAGDMRPTVYGNASYRVVKQASLDGSIWYISLGDGVSITRFSIGAGYSF